MSITTKQKELLLELYSFHAAKMAGVVEDQRKVKGLIKDLDASGLNGTELIEACRELERKATKEVSKDE